MNTTTKPTRHRLRSARSINAAIASGHHVMHESAIGIPTGVTDARDLTGQFTGLSSRLLYVRGVDDRWELVTGHVYYDN